MWQYSVTASYIVLCNIDMHACENVSDIDIAYPNGNNTEIPIQCNFDRRKYLWIWR